MDGGDLDSRALINYASALDAALELADIGVPVFPVRLTQDNKKKPTIADWRHNASTDERQITAWFTNATFLIGVPTGSLSGYDVLDVDPRHGGDAWLVENRHRLPPTAEHRTMQGGTHFLFHHHVG